MLTAISTDGTKIAAHQGGSGPHLVLVHGTSATASRWNGIRPALEERFTVTAIDRRGRGGSGDGPDYAIEREYEDIVAVIERLDGPVTLFGHSYGAVVSLGAAARCDRIARLILYEPPDLEDRDSTVPPEVSERLVALLEKGERAEAVRTFMREVPRVPPEGISALESSPAWPERVAAAHTLPREITATVRWEADNLGKLTVPVLLLLGGDSPLPFRRATERLDAMLPDARTFVMPGQQHVAMDSGPDMVLKALFDFCR